MDFRQSEQRLKTLEKRIKCAEYSQENRDIILEYEADLFISGIKLITVLNNMSAMHGIAKVIDFDLKTATKTDIVRYVGQLEHSNYSQGTKTRNKQAIKRFYKWLNGGTYPECVDWIKIKNHNSKVLPEELLTSEEIKNMIDSARHPRDKAIVATLYDSGARIAEIGTAKIKHIQFDQYGAVLMVNGKTGMRRVRLIFSVPYLSAWLDIHPDKDNPDAPIWVAIGTRNFGDRLTYSSYLKLVKTCAERAGIKKKIHPHMFRHSRATEIANHLTESQMNAHLGWVAGSNMPATYVHLSGKQVDDAILKMHGMVKQEDMQTDLTQRPCPRCEFVNGPTSRYCGRCGMALDVVSAIDVDQERNVALTKLMELIKMNPDVAKLLK